MDIYLPLHKINFHTSSCTKCPENGMVIAAFALIILIFINMSKKLVLIKVKLQSGEMHLLKIKTKQPTY